MDCFLCLELNSNTESGIQINSADWLEKNVQKIIEKHLWPMTMYKTESQWLCLTCWQILQEFHKFYNRIENAHINLSGLMKSETDGQKSKDLLAINLLEPEIVLDQPIAFVKQEYKEFDSENENNNDHDNENDNDDNDNDNDNDQDDEDYKDEDDIPLIHIRPSVETPLGDPINDSDQSIEDPLTGYEKRTRGRKRKPKTDNNKSPPKPNKKTSRETETDCKVKSEPDTSDTHHDTSVSSMLMISKNDTNSPPRYYFQSKITIRDYDEFIAQHFKLICSKCQSPVMTFEELQQHFVEIHKKKQGYVVCCGTKFRDRGFLVDHINVHLNPEYFKCEHCDEVLTLRKTYKNHLKTHEKIYGCEICEKKFISKYLVNKHKLTHLPEEEKKFPCDACDKCFASENLLTSHQRVVHLKKYSKLCEICGQSIPNSETFKRHMEKHEGITEPTMSCEICGRLVGSKHSLRVHMKSIHPEDGKHEFVCHVCLKISPNKRALREHIRRVHASGYDHKCTICEKAFKRMDHLKDHMATHTGVGTSKCPWCPKVFNANSSMHLHRKKVHPKEWEEVRRKRYSGNMPPNSKPQVVAASDMNNIPIHFNL